MKNHAFYSHRLLLASLYSFFFIVGVYAADYDPGETLSPNCVPGAVGCTVTAPAVSGANSDITSLSGLTTPLSITQGGTGLNSIPANRLLYTSDLNTLSLLSFGDEGEVLKIVDGALSWDSVDYSAGTGLALTDTTFSVANGGLTSAHLADGTIVSADISSSAAIPFSKLNITQSDIIGLGIPAADTDTTYIAGLGLELTDTTFSIDENVLTSNYTGSAHFTGTLTASSFSGNGASLTDVNATSISDDTITSGKITDGTIVNADISSSAAIPFSKLDITQSDITSLGICEATNWSSWTPTTTNLSSVSVSKARYKVVDNNLVAFELTLTGTGNGSTPTVSLPSTPDNKGAFGTLIIASGSTYVSGFSFVNPSNTLSFGIISLGNLILSAGISYEIHISGTYEV